jgi:perosamine synthetase
MNPEPAGTINDYWMPTIVVDEGVPFNRENLVAVFKADNIDGRVFFWSLSMLSMFVEKPEKKVSHNLYQRSLNLPRYHDLCYEHIKNFIDEV